MNRPRTLLEFAGVQPTIVPWSQSLLLLIDAQMEYVSGHLPLSGIEAAVRECSRLLALARKAGAPVIHVVHHGKPGAVLFNPQGGSVSVTAEVQPNPGEEVVIKSLPNAFAGTNLDELIRNTGRRQLVIVGFATHMCVSSTARSALDHGYGVTVVAAACATRDLPKPAGGTVPAQIVHETALAELADRFATVLPSSSAWETTGEVQR